MKNLDFEWLTDEFMLYCRSTQVREKTMSSYEQTLHLWSIAFHWPSATFFLHFSTK